MFLKPIKVSLKDLPEVQMVLQGPLGTFSLKENQQ